MPATGGRGRGASRWKGQVLVTLSTYVDVISNKGRRNNNFYQMLPPIARKTNAADTIPARFLHSSLNKVKYPINVVLWTPEGRRLLTASTSGEFTLWNGMAFNFETIMQAHEAAVRTATYSHWEDWLISGDQEGTIKYWQPNFNNVKEIQAHERGSGVRGLAFAPTDVKFVSGSDDATIKVFDFARGDTEVTMTGHSWEVRCVDWHPKKGLIVSGSKDNTVKLWDPRNGHCLTTISSSKQQISRTVFEPSQGIMLATCGRDKLTRIFDIRMMRDTLILRGHENDVTSIVWHPVHRKMITTADHQGAINHYLLDEQHPPPGMEYTKSPYDTENPKTLAQNIYPAHSVPYAHEGTIWALDWHPVGHILASGSNDRVTRFWTRPRPGEEAWATDRYHIGQDAAQARGTYNREGMARQQREAEEQEEMDEEDGLVDQKLPSKASVPGIAALPGLVQSAPAQNGSGGLSTLLPGIAGAPAVMPPFPPPGGLPVPPLNAGPVDLSKIAELFGGQFPPPPPPGLAGPGAFPPPGLPNPTAAGQGAPPPWFTGGALQPPPPGAYQPPPMQIQLQDGAVNGDPRRRRAPLPSQQEALQQETRRGNVRPAR
jgi:polyadenylation factor subunit 2